MRRRVGVMDGFGVGPPTLTDPTDHSWAGIDPGKTGYVVVVFPDDSIRSWPIPLSEDGKKYDLKAVWAIVRKLKALNVHHVTLEAQQPTRLRADQGGAANNAVRASFMTGYGFALWEMALTACGVSYDLAWPSHWKKKMGLTVPKEFKGVRTTEVKRISRELATILWPDHDFRRTPRSQPSPDQCEAALLARYGMQKHG